MTGFVVVNPFSAGGRTAREWPRIERALRAAYPHMHLAMTQTRGDATALVRDALREGHHEIVAVGGDGTINEAVNGLFDADGAIMPDAVASPTPSNTMSAGAVDGSEMGAFARDKNPIKERGLLLKYQEYMPAGLVPVIVHVT